MQRAYLACCWFLLSCIAPATARSQIVNVQPLVATEAESGFSGAFEGAADWRTGNTKLLMVSGSLLAQYRTEAHFAFMITRGEVGIQGGKRFMGKDFEHLRYRYDLLDWFQLETFGQHDRDDFRRLSLRALWGAGPRLTAPITEDVQIAFGAAYMLEFERLNRGDHPDAGEERVSHRLSSYMNVQCLVSDKVRIAGTAYLQPRIDRWRDQRMLSEAELLVSVTDRLSVKLSFSAAHDSEPPASLGSLDTMMKSSIQVRF